MPAIGQKWYAVFVFLSSLGGCSLFKIELPAEPLPERELEARVLTREYALEFMDTIGIEIDSALGSVDDDAQRVAALRFRINASTECALAAMQVFPVLAMLDTWTYTAQLHNFVRSPEGRRLLGPVAVKLSPRLETLEATITRHARRVATAGEFQEYQAIVARHVENYPIMDLKLRRQPISSVASSADAGVVFGAGTVGTAAQAMSDVADRIRLLNAQVPNLTRWQMEVVAHDSGITSENLAYAAERLDAHLVQIGRIVDTAPATSAATIRELRATTEMLSREISALTESVIASLAAERQAIAAVLGEQQQVLYEQIDEQRRVLTTDVDRISSTVVTQAWAELHRLTRNVGLLVFAYTIMVMTLPFIAGFLLGRARPK